MPEDISGSVGDALANHTINSDQKPTRDVEYLRWRAAVAVQLQKAGMQDEYELWVSCSDPAGFFVPDYSGDLPGGVVGVNCCSHDPKHQAMAVCPTCQLRFCPDCCHRQTARLLNRYMPFLRDIVADSDDVAALRHIVLTTPIDLRHSDCRKMVLDLCKKLPECFDLLLGDDWRSDCGLMFAYEFGETGHKLHFHILAYCPYIDHEALSDAWRQVTGGLCEVTYIRQVSDDPEKGQTLEDAAAEVLKYASKLFKRDAKGDVKCLEPELVPLLAKVLKGTRRIRSYGLFYKLEAKDEPHVCEVCSSPVVRLSPLEWQIFCETGWLPDQWRVVIEGDEYGLDLILGNNFLDTGQGKQPFEVQLQLILPLFDAVLDGKYRKQFSLEGKHG